MSEKTARDVEHEVSDWWQSSIIDMKPGEIRYSGYAIEDLIGNVSFPAMIWLMTRGELPNPKQAKLLEAALVAAVDHGPQAPSIAIARMAATCGVGLNNAMASAVNVLGDVHGGAGEQAVALYRDIARRIDDGVSVAQAVSDGLDHQISEHGKHIPGFGHRFHPTDPRAPRLLRLVEYAAKDGIVNGYFGMIAREVEKTLEARKGKKIPMNIDGATAVIYAELGFDAPLARGLFCLSRSVGILAHAWEQTQQGGRNKGPIPRRMIWNYTGHEPRPVPMEKQEG
ncbi:citryl-CoA lyase [Thalassospira lohafexi]|uniref:citrate synthase (unknown stereospecificity) n=1 Tax=Thalassospira lohafexi TaxID=744227 RepID=A0A2N3L9I2_9PROT|nr:citryl-CoA lyase [Thalassospira lohafexi]PKR59454.1 citryl-CoA lyase [Thalassospira lohafexi]